MTDPSYLIEATLDTGQRLQSESFALEVNYHAAVFDLRSQMMVEAVAVIALHTGEVLLDVPSFLALARVSLGRRHGSSQA